MVAPSVSIKLQSVAPVVAAVASAVAVVVEVVDMVAVAAAVAPMVVVATAAVVRVVVADTVAKVVATVVDRVDTAAAVVSRSCFLNINHTDHQTKDTPVVEAATVAARTSNRVAAVAVGNFRLEC
jgi:hypothetical protein